MFERTCQLLGRFTSRAFGKYLLATNTISSGVLMLLGDVIEQEIHFEKKENKPRYDYGRLARMFIVGLSMGPVHHYYYGYINVLWPARTISSVTKKIVADQFIMSPICIMQFFYTLGLLERKSLTQTNTEIINKFVAVYTMDWCVWPPSQFINFYFIPCKYQVLYINFITMLYDVFLSYIKHDSHTGEIKAKKHESYEGEIRVDSNLQLKTSPKFQK